MRAHLAETLACRGVDKASGGTVSPSEVVHGPVTSAISNLGEEHGIVLRLRASPSTTQPSTHEHVVVHQAAAAAAALTEVCREAPCAAHHHLAGSQASQAHSQGLTGYHA